MCYRLLIVISLLLFGALPTAAQTITPTPLTETYTTTTGESFTFQYPADWYVLETVESIIITDSEETFEQFSIDAEAAMQSGMVVISILRPQTLSLGFALDADTTLDDFVALIEAQLQGITPEEIELGEHPAYRFQYPPQRFDAAAFAFESGGLYFATLATATGELSTHEPTVRAIFASFTPLADEISDLPEVEVDETLVSELFTPQLAPLTFEYPEGWTISESEFGAIALANSDAEGNVFEPPVTGIVRVQINFTQAGELPFNLPDADARAVLEFTAAADEAILPLVEPYSEISEFLVGGYPTARVDSLSEPSEITLMVVKVEDWFITIRVTAFPDELVEYEPTIMAVIASMSLPIEVEMTPEATLEATSTP